MDRRIVLASPCIAIFAIMLLGMFPGVYDGTNISLPDYFKAWVPQRTEVSQIETGFDQASWDIRYHLGGNGPWIPKVSGIAVDDIDPPPRCLVDQVHMVGLEDFNR